MNVYDPADYIVYVRMDRGTTTSSVAGAPDLMGNRLPSGYANGSPRTRLRGRAAVRSSRLDEQLPRPGAPTSSSPEQAGSRTVDDVA